MWLTFCDSIQRQYIALLSSVQFVSLAQCILLCILCANMIFRLLLWRACAGNTFCNEKQIHITFNAIVSSCVYIFSLSFYSIVGFYGVHARAFHVIYGRKFTCTRPNWNAIHVEMNVTWHFHNHLIHTLRFLLWMPFYASTATSNSTRHSGIHLIHLSSFWPN